MFELIDKKVIYNFTPFLSLSGHDGVSMEEQRFFVAELCVN